MKKVKHILFSCSLLFFSSVSVAQQESIVTMYPDQMNIFNPAFAGVDGTTSLSIGNRRQWIGVNNAPESQMLVFGTSVGKNLGIGLTVTNDKLFIEKQTNAGIDFSYKIKMSDDTDLYLGIKAGAKFHEINTSGLLTFNSTGDPDLVPYNAFTPNVGVGALLKTEKYYLSLSIPRLLNSVRARNEGNQIYAVMEQPNLYFSGGYEYDLQTRSQMVIKPSFLMRYVNGAPVSIDYNLGVGFFDRFELGAVYRSGNSMGGIVKLDISKRLLFGYAYELTTRSDVANSISTHEFLLKYNFK